MATTTPMPNSSSPVRWLCSFGGFGGLRGFGVFLGLQGFRASVSGGFWVLGCLGEFGGMQGFVGFRVSIGGQGGGGL